MRAFINAQQLWGGVLEIQMEAAARSGNLKTVKRLHEQGQALTPEVLRSAKSGYSENVLRYAYEMGCEWDEWPQPNPSVFKWLRHHNSGAWGLTEVWDVSGMMVSAAGEGRVDVVRFLKERGCELNVSVYVAGEKHEDVKEYLIGALCPAPYDDDDDDY